jgi:pectin methylesterase-like acyl-CoA thioesterase
MKFVRVRGGVVFSLVMFVAMTGWAAPKKKVVTVAADGSGDFKDVQSAVDSDPEGNVVIRIKPGIYKQLVNIKANGVELRGLGKQPQDVVLTYNNSHALVNGTWKSASIMVSGDDFVAENLTMENSFERENPKPGPDAQAVALFATGDRQVYRRVRFLGYQDTLYADSKTCHLAPAQQGGAPIPAEQMPVPCAAARQFYEECYIEGHVDFIFGDAKAAFKNCEIHALAHSMDTLTAQSKLYPAEDSGYLFLDCTVTGEEGAKNIFMGRPWRTYSTAVFVNTDFKVKLNQAGWQEWGGRISTSYYADYKSHGESGDVSQRLAGTHVLTDEEAKKYTVKEWLAGKDGWDPAKVK